jgi:pyrimidine deaminase RibD-like protein
MGTSSFLGVRSLNASEISVIRNEVLEWFLLGFGLQIPDNGLGRPTTITPLWLAAREKCGDCEMDEVLDALYNLGPDHAELSKFVEVGGGFQPVSFERRRNTPQWKDFFTRGDFRVKVLPAGRVRFQKLDELLGSARGSTEVGITSPDYQFARLAIDEARKSVSESDGRPHPKVGAVVVKNGRVLSTAHRGELAANHAEYIALEKKLSDEAVAGATVYTTLEPCTTRNHPKIPCAERLIERRVSRVVMGMLDPDTRITGRGQRKLRAAGIVTDFFPAGLMTEVEELNREFTRFCEQRSQAPEAQPGQSALRLTGSDPRVYMEVSEPTEAMFARTPFVLHNRGGDVAHNVQIHPVKLSRNAVTFESVAAIAPNDKAQVLPHIEGAGALAQHNIVYWLNRDWDTNGEIIEEWSVPVAITYEDFGKATFETRLCLVYLPIKDSFRKNHSGWPKDDSAILEVRNFEFRRVG